MSIGIGGSGGVFAPSLFIGVTSGMAFIDTVRHLLGAAAGKPALYAVIAMGAGLLPLGWLPAAAYRASS